MMIIFYSRLQRWHADCCVPIMPPPVPAQVRRDGKRVPDEAPPLDRHGREFWPPGWEERPVKEVTCEQDIFELIGLPYREPCHRNYP